MAGGLLNLVSYSQSSILLFGNPTKSIFQCAYKKITNYGMQKFRIDYEGSRLLRMNEETKMEFKVPRYGDMLYETCLVLNIPDIWSPVYYDTNNQEWVEYGFKWIQELGSNMIKEVEILADGQSLAKYTGEYFSLIAKRDYEERKLDIWNEMTGNTTEINDPANAYSRINVYPNAYYFNSTSIRPSIMGRKLYIPLDAWFSKLPCKAFPLIKTQYVELRISITLRPIRELYIIRDVKDSGNNYPYIAPNMNEPYQQLVNFIYPPDNTDQTVTLPKQENWNADIHLMSTYIFLDTKERMYVASENNELLITQMYEWVNPNIAGSKVVEFYPRNLVENFMFRFRRSDVFLRNQWSNYTNFPYEGLPFNVSNQNIPPYMTPSPNIFTTGNYTPQTFNANVRGILQDMAIVLNGKYRENLLDVGVYQYMEKLNKIKANVGNDVYFYSFSTKNDSHLFQPYGAINMDKFDKVTLEFNTIEPPIDPSSAFTDLCDQDGNVIGTRKNVFDLFEYNFDLSVYEERINVLVFNNGLVGLKYAIG